MTPTRSGAGAENVGSLQVLWSDGERVFCLQQCRRQRVRDGAGELDCSQAGNVERRLFRALASPGAETLIRPLQPEQKAPLRCAVGDGVEQLLYPTQLKEQSRQRFLSFFLPTWSSQPICYRNQSVCLSIPPSCWQDQSVAVPIGARPPRRSAGGFSQARVAPAPGQKLIKLVCSLTKGEERARRGSFRCTSNHASIDQMATRHPPAAKREESRH